MAASTATASAGKVTARVIDGAGASTGTRDLPVEIFGVKVNEALLHQVMLAERAAARSGTASTKTRSEVRGGGKKPWRQKGTGRARHGSIRAPQWVGGGTVFGPKPRKYAVKVNKKMRAAALRSALTTKATTDAVWILDGFSDTRTKTAAQALEAAGCTYRLVPGSAGSFDYYTGLTFRVFAGDIECASGGRYDGLGETIGGRAVPASGFGADLLRLAELMDGGQ